MSLSTEAFKALESHWAVQAIKPDDHARAMELVRERLAQHAVGEQITFDFIQTEKNAALLKRVAMAYEMAAIEGLPELSRPSSANSALRDQAMAACHRVFDIRRILALPDGPHDRLFFVLQLSALAYCGDRWSDWRRWYDAHKEKLEPPSVADAAWDQRLLYRLYHCWIRLFRKEGWDDLDRIRETISELREDQKTLEARQLPNGSPATHRAMALRLVALYHWAKGTEILALYMLQGEPTDPLGQIDRHFEAGIKAATAAGDAQHEIILRWLHATGHRQVTHSLWWATRT